MIVRRLYRIKTDELPGTYILTAAMVRLALRAAFPSLNVDVQDVPGSETTEETREETDKSGR